MKKWLLIGVWVFGMSACTTPETVHLYGLLKDMGTQEVIMRYNGASSMVGDSRDIILRTDANGKFDTVLPLEKPEYYSINRNTLWLNPGDELEMVITQDNREAVFKGRGAEANIYMKERLFPKGGSFLEGGSNIRENFGQTVDLIHELAAKREKQLDGLKGVSERFRQMERARIYADVINSYLSYGSYSIEYEGKSGKEIAIAEQRNIAEVAAEIKEKVEYLNDECYLDVAVVRDILYYRMEPAYAEIFSGYVPGERCRELYEGSQKVAGLRHALNQQIVDDCRAYVNSMKQADFAAELEVKVDRAARLLPGQPAPDFVMTDTSGNEKRLSDFKGKVIYIDLWATWCGPCIQESPAFAGLSVRYPDILFLQISRDEQRGAWLNYISHKNSPLIQYNSVDLNLVEGWQMFYIPRFILVDKDQKIIDAYAPLPSSEEIVNLLDDCLNG